MMTCGPNNSRFVFTVATIEQLVGCKVLNSSTFPTKRAAKCMVKNENARFLFPKVQLKCWEKKWFCIQAKNG